MRFFPRLTLSQLIIFFIFSLTFLLTMGAILRPDFFKPHDFTHVTRIVEMSRSLAAGEFPVRWSRNFGFGYGMPLFNFYAPLPYYLAQIPYALMVGGVNSVKMLYLLNAVLSFIGMYLLASELWGKKGGLLSSIVFSFSTYRALDLYVRGALGEVMAMSILPFTLYGAVLMARGKKHGAFVVILSSAALLLSHNLIGMLGVGCIAAFGVLAIAIESFSSKIGWKKIVVRFFSFTGALIGGGLLSAFYTIPGFIEKSATRVEATITTGYFDFHNHLLLVRQLFLGKWGYGGSAPYPYGGMSFALGVFSIALLVLAVLVVMMRSKRKEKMYAAVCVVLLIATTFMTLNKSVQIWEMIPTLKYIQFPWRFLTFTDIFLSLLAGCSVWIVRLRKEFFVIPFILTIGMIVRQAPLFTPEKFLTPEQMSEEYYEDPMRIRSTMSKTLNDYLPPSVMDNALPSPVNERLSMTTQGSKVEMLSDASASFKAKVYCPKDCRFVANIFQFPRWRAWVDGTIVGTYTDQQDLISDKHLPIYEVMIPKGEHIIEMQLINTVYRWIGNTLSLSTLVILTLVFFFRSRVWRKFWL
jgi:hypothetical protein